MQMMEWHFVEEPEHGNVAFDVCELPVQRLVSAASPQFLLEIHAKGYAGTLGTPRGTCGIGPRANSSFGRLSPNLLEGLKNAHQ